MAEEPKAERHSPAPSSADCPALSLSPACWVLRITLALMCWGLAAKVLFVKFVANTNIFGLLFFDQVGQDLFGRKWSQAEALSVDRIGAWVYLFAGAALLVLPAIFAAGGQTRWARFGRRWELVWEGPLLVFVALWTLLVAWAQAYRGGEFMSDYTLAAHAARFLTPVALLLWLPAIRTSDTSPSCKEPSRKQAVLTWLGETVLRCGIGITFFIHGWEALLRNPNFVDLILFTDDHLLGWELSERAAKDLLGVIGCLDMLAVMAIVTRRWRSVALWMAFWGTLTAFSRVTAEGWDKYPEVLLRTTHAGVPLALFVYWQWSCRRSSPRTDSPSRPQK